MDKLLNIKQAAEVLGVSVDTLRRWDSSEKLQSVRVKRGKYKYRYYSQEDIRQYLKNLDIFSLAKDWADAQEPESPLRFFYCQNNTIFNGRLSKFESSLMQSGKFDDSFSLMVLIAGEIGNNSFDHNLGNWPDVMGVFFGYNIDKRIIVLADRGQGILKTLVRAKTDLKTHEEALKTAFTEFISGRVPEKRGNGLKVVKRIVMKNNFKLFFQTGNAFLQMNGGNDELNIKKAKNNIQGCIACLKF